MLPAKVVSRCFFIHKVLLTNPGNEIHNHKYHDGLDMMFSSLFSYF